MQRCVADTGDVVSAGKSVDYPTPFILFYLDLNFEQNNF